MTLTQPTTKLGILQNVIHHILHVERRFEEKNKENALLGQRRKVVGGVPNGAGKSDMWMMVETTVKGEGKG
jgi:hypothetical protein